MDAATTWVIIPALNEEASIGRVLDDIPREGEYAASDVIVVDNGSTDGTAVGAEIHDVTRGGDKCTDFASCAALLADGADIDYDGLGGPYDFVDAGEPAAASFRIATYDGGETPNTDLDEYVFAS